MDLPTYSRKVFEKQRIDEMLGREVPKQFSRAIDYYYWYMNFYKALETNKGHIPDELPVSFPAFLYRNGGVPEGLSRVCSERGYDVYFEAEERELRRRGGSVVSDRYD